MDDPEIDNVTRARDLWRKNPKISASELKDAINLPTTKVAQEILRSALAKEQELKQKLAAEDSAADQPRAVAQDIDQVPWLRDPETGMSQRLELVSKNQRSVVFQLLPSHKRPGQAANYVKVP